MEYQLLSNYFPCVVIPGFFQILARLLMVWSFAFLLGATVDQRLVDDFLAKYFGFIPASFWTYLSAHQFWIQRFLTSWNPSLPFIKAAQLGILYRLYLFLAAAAASFWDVVTGLFGA